MFAALFISLFSDLYTMVFFGWAVITAFAVLDIIKCFSDLSQTCSRGIFLAEGGFEAKLQSKQVIFWPMTTIKHISYSYFKWRSFFTTSLRRACCLHLLELQSTTMFGIISLLYRHSTVVSDHLNQKQWVGIHLKNVLVDCEIQVRRVSCIDLTAALVTLIRSAGIWRRKEGGGWSAQLYNSEEKSLINHFQRNFLSICCCTVFTSVTNTFLRFLFGSSSKMFCHGVMHCSDL